MNKKSMGQFIAALRKAKGYTQQDVADSLGVSNKAVSRWERDETAPDISIIPALAELLEVTCDELLRGEKINSLVGASEKNDVRVDKQIKLLVKRTASKFKNQMWISMAIAISGYILLMGISYAFYRPKLGFALMMLFEVAAAVWAIISINKIKENKADNDLFDRAEEQDITNYNKIVGKYGFWSIFTIVSIIAISIPLICVETEYVESVLVFSIYLECCIPILIILIGLYSFIKVPIQKKLTGMITATQRTDVIVRIMNAVQISALGLLILMGTIHRQMNYFYYLDMDAQDNLNMCIRITILIVISIVITAFVVALILSKKQKRIVVPSGVRNILQVINLCVMLEIYYDNYYMYGIDKLWNPICVAVAILLIIVFGIIEFVIKKRSEVD